MEDGPDDTCSQQHFETDEQPKADSFSSAEDWSDEDLNYSRPDAEFNSGDYIADYIQLSNINA